MKTLSVLTVCLMLALSGCKNNDDAAVTPTPAATKPAYQVAIDEKAKALHWDTDGHAPDNGGMAIQTKAKKGWVQYYTKNLYGSEFVKDAIYYFEGKGAFALNSTFKDKYDALGQDNFALITSDGKSTDASSLYTYHEISRVDNGGEGIILTVPGLKIFAVYGEIYKEYLRLNRWAGPLGYPSSDEVDLTSKKGRYNAFLGGQIYWGATTGAHAFWGRVERLYSPTGYDTGWLGLPTSSCDPALADTKQLIRFEKGVINAAACGSYQNSVGETVFQNGTRSTNVSNIPCY